MARSMARYLRQGLRILVHDELWVLDAPALVDGGRHDRGQRPALVGTLGRSQRLPHRCLGGVRLTKAGANHERASLTVLVGLGVDVRLAAVAREVRTSAEQLAKVRAGIPRVETLEDKPRNQAGGRAVIEQELVHVGAFEGANRDRIDGVSQRGELAAAQTNLVLHGSKVLVLKPLRKDLFDPYDLELGRLAVRVALLGPTVARHSLHEASLKVCVHGVVGPQRLLPGLAVLRVVRQAAEQSTHRAGGVGRHQAAAVGCRGRRCWRRLGKRQAVKVTIVKARPAGFF